MIKKCRIVWNGCAPIRERRPTIAQDVEEYE